MDHNKNFIDAMPPRSAFWLGFVTAVLSIGTLGFIVLGSCTLKNNCPITVGAQVAAAAPAAAPAAAAAPAPDATTVAVSKVPAVDAKVDFIQGEANAPVTIVEYSDFQCPFCERFHGTMKQIMTDYKGKVRWILRPFPLSFHPEAVNAAVAAECAGRQGKFWEYGDKLIENQETLGEDLYKKLATDLGLDASKLATCRADKSVTDFVNKTSAGGGAAGVNGTPGTFIFKTNAKGTDQATIIKGAQPAASVKAAIDALLK